MIEIAGRPILWHIMKYFSVYGVNDFVICCGYKGNIIKQYFRDYSMNASELVIDLGRNVIEDIKGNIEPWRITLIDTGVDTGTAGRLKHALPFLQDSESFFFTYGDGLTNHNLHEQIKFHNHEAKLATVLAVSPPGRYGEMVVENGLVKDFIEKPRNGKAVINGGYFILSPRVIEYIKDKKENWEAAPLSSLVADGQLSAYHHRDFWYAMDTMRDKVYLENLWNNNEAPWRVWSD
jgi:glucose-1-phosphate cytidylyltransferase